MSKDRATIGIDGVALPILPPERDARVWARLVRVMFYLHGPVADQGGRTGKFWDHCRTANAVQRRRHRRRPVHWRRIVGCGCGCFVQGRHWSGSLLLELLAVVPFLCAVPALFHELAHSRLLHANVPGAVDVALGASELLPMVAILPFMLYQLAGFGTMHFVVPKSVNWTINIGILCLITASYVANRWQIRMGKEIRSF